MNNKSPKPLNPSQPLNSKSLEPSNPLTLEPLKKGWKLVKLGEVCEKPQYGYTASAEYKEISPKLLRITDIQNRIVNWETVPYCKCDYELNKYLLKTGGLEALKILGDPKDIINETKIRLFAA